MYTFVNQSVHFFYLCKILKIPQISQKVDISQKPVHFFYMPFISIL